MYRFLGATSSAEEHHMRIDRPQRIPEPIEQVIRQNISEVASTVVRSAGGDWGQRSKARHTAQNRRVAYKIGAGEALRLKFFILFFATVTVTYARAPNFLLNALLDVLFDTCSPLNLERAPLKTRFGPTETHGVLAVTPVSAKRRFRPTCSHPQRAWKELAPKASRC